MTYETPLCRASDPITSFESADSAKEFISSHETRILIHLNRQGAMGVDAIGFYAGIEPHAVGKRMTALHKRGEVALTGRTVKSDSGRNQREWIAT